jgi:hypothetical protein
MTFSRVKHSLISAVRFGSTLTGLRNFDYFAVMALAVIAFCYYGAFYNFAFNLADEGSVALISEKLLKGERPFVDIETGYGILWYLPIVYLFKVFGVKFYLIRIYFLLIAFAATLCAYGLMLRLTANRLIAFTVALVVLWFPGSIHKTYLPFLVISGLYVLSLYDARTLKPIIAPWLALFCTGVYLGFAFLIRGDIATIFFVLFVVYHGMLTLQSSIHERSFSKFLVVPAHIAVLAGVVLLVGLPFAFKAYANGYLEGFLHQYTAFVEHLISTMKQRFLNEPSATVSTTGTLLPRANLSAFFHNDKQRGFIFLTYAPVFAFFSIVIGITVDFFRGGLSLNKISAFFSERALLLVMLIGAFSTFPQFFLWRPDMGHLSQFMPGFVVLMAYVLFVLGNHTDVADKYRAGHRLLFYVTLSLSLLYLVEFAKNQRDGLYLRRGNHDHLVMAKGIDLYVNPKQFQLISQLNAAITESSRPDDFVLCFPYCPGINFIADRPTFQKYLYVDNSFLIMYPDWLEDMRSAIATKKPRVIVISDWAVNTSEHSRFRNWAKPIYDDITRMYEQRLALQGYEVFVLK